MEKHINGKVILVTGGTGSIGGEIVKRLLCYKPKSVRIFSRDEAKQFTMQNQLSEFSNVRYFIGDVRDKDRLSRAMKDCDIVFHAAALKQVPACEYNPFEAVKTNVIGTQCVIEAAIEQEVKNVIAISTDKAVNPINTMGATKLLAEKLIIDANFYRGDVGTVFACVRFGNVIGSRSSVVPFFEEQIKKGGPITITEPEMIRFIMPINKAVELVFKALTLAKGGEIFILKMPIIKLIDLAEVILENVASKYNINSKDIKIEYVGRRPGEKISEALMTEEEALNAIETDDMFIIYPDVDIPNLRKQRYTALKNRKQIPTSYTCNTQTPLTKQELKKLLILAGTF